VFVFHQVSNAAPVRESLKRSCKNVDNKDAFLNERIKANNARAAATRAKFMNDIRRHKAKIAELEDMNAHLKGMNTDLTTLNTNLFNEVKEGHEAFNHQGDKISELQDEVLDLSNQVGNLTEERNDLLHRFLAHVTESNHALQEMKEVLNRINNIDNMNEEEMNREIADMERKYEEKEAPPVAIQASIDARAARDAAAAAQSFNDDTDVDEDEQHEQEPQVKVEEEKKIPDSQPVYTPSSPAYSPSSPIQQRSSSPAYIPSSPAHSHRSDIMQIEESVINAPRTFRMPNALRLPEDDIKEEANSGLQVRG